MLADRQRGGARRSDDPSRAAGGFDWGAQLAHGAEAQPFNKLAYQESAAGLRFNPAAVQPQPNRNFYQ